MIAHITVVLLDDNHNKRVISVEEEILDATPVSMKESALRCARKVEGALKT